MPNPHFTGNSQLDYKYYIYIYKDYKSQNLQNSK